MTNKKVLKNSLIYTFNNILLKAFNFLLLPLYTVFLTTTDYGVINLLSSFSAVSTYIIAFSLYSAVIRFYADYKHDLEKVRTFFGTVICFVFLSGCVFFILALLLKNVLAKFLFQGVDFYPSVLMALIALVFTSLYTIYQDILKGMQEARKSAMVSISYFFLQVILNILFVAFFSWGANGVLLSLVISSSLACIWMLFDLKRLHLIRFCLDKTILKETLSYSIPIIPHNLSTQIAQFVSKVFINGTSSLASVGLFSLASRFGSLADLVQSSVNAAFQPWFYDQMNKKGFDRKQIVDLSSVLVWFYSFLFLCVGLFCQELIVLMASSQYEESWKLVPLIVITFSLKTPYYFYINILFYYKKASKYIFTATVTSSLVNVALSYFLIQKYGMYGSVAADAIAMVIRVGIVVWISNKFDKIGYNIGHFIGLSLLTVLFLVTGLYFSYTRYANVISFGNIVYKAVVLLVFLSIVYLANRGSIQDAFAVLRKKKARKGNV
ncbi:membrane protein involved in the export of O-antigen and teichoic acid [Sphaerochaeta pleomorpha str. Grapes]|uniref:Membrane protein involved in the export of O-antigen and teichoic acid n=1 Tax=Sphaerochaeta pleomorpha (strain ATCC BAA-1885 / DSM 22778 / Grapes) TaxID=158190 RepID=G8QVT0_SPHPG|nr:oligosaccharide flippase family protein [Sphaerochaeta pleomorpha]AEV29372.1 membrane protein involved in the export of O-antigen and teichoic acid [Sphaerochaeta pleomorpha str. Grapes]